MLLPSISISMFLILKLRIYYYDICVILSQIIYFHVLPTCIDLFCTSLPEVSGLTNNGPEFVLNRAGQIRYECLNTTRSYHAIYTYFYILYCPFVQIVLPPVSF